MADAEEASTGGDPAGTEPSLAVLGGLLKDILNAETGNAEIRLLRKALAEAFAVIDAQARTIREMREEIDEMKRKLAYYESENMSTSTLSLYNKRRAKFRKGRGEDPAGGPGERARQGGGGGGGEKPAKNGKKAGPPAGHEGVSHHNKATLPPLYYFLKTAESPCCGAKIIMLLHACKMVHDLDESFRVQSAMCVAERGACSSCGRIFKAETPFLEGTSLGPVLLAVIMIMFSRANTDQGIADMVHGIFGFEMGANTVYNARRAVSGRLQEGMIALIMRAIQLQPGVQMDEGKYRRGDGRDGYVWVAYTPVAVFVFFAYSREAAVLDVHFAWLRGRPVTCDGYRGYPSLTDVIQRDYIHILRKAERVAVEGGDPGDEARYDMLLGLYRDAKKTPALAPFTRMTLARRAHKIAASYKDKEMQTHLLNAIPRLFTFRAHSGMSPHSNDVEREIRDGIIPQRNVRHTTMTAGGRALMSTLLTFTRTCRRQDMSPGRALLEYVLDGTWNIFERAKDTPYSIVNPDGSRHSVFAGLDPPTVTATTSGARQDQAAAARTVAA